MKKTCLAVASVLMMMLHPSIARAAEGELPPPIAFVSNFLQLSEAQTGSLIAMIQGPDNKTYLVHQGDKLLDGTIKTITPQGLIVIQEVNDPLSLVKQREIRKLLRSLEDAKE